MILLCLSFELDGVFLGDLNKVIKRLTLENSLKKKKS